HRPRREGTPRMTSPADLARRKIDEASRWGRDMAVENDELTLARALLAAEARSTENEKGMAWLRSQTELAERQCGEQRDRAERLEAGLREAYDLLAHGTNGHLINQACAVITEALAPKETK